MKFLLILYYLVLILLYFLMLFIYLFVDLDAYGSGHALAT